MRIERYGRFWAVWEGETLVCVTILKPGYSGSDDLRSALQARVAQALGKAMTPREILFVQDLPRTRNAKIMRRVVRAVYLGKDPGDLSALENPSAVEGLKAMAGTAAKPPAA